MLWCERIDIFPRIEMKFNSFTHPSIAHTPFSASRLHVAVNSSIVGGKLKADNRQQKHHLHHRHSIPIYRVCVVCMQTLILILWFQISSSKVNELIICLNHRITFFSIPFLYAMFSTPFIVRNLIFSFDISSSSTHSTSRKKIIPSFIMTKISLAFCC